MEPFSTAPDATADAAFPRLRRALLAAVGLVIAVVTVMTALEVLYTRSSAEAEATRHIGNLTRSLEVFAGSAFQATDLAVCGVVDALEAGDLRARPDRTDVVNRLLRDRLSAHTPYRNLAVADADGYVRYDAVSDTSHINISDRDYFKVHRESPDIGLYISPPILSRAGRGWFVAVSRRIGTPDGGFAGVVYAAIDLAYFETFFAGLDLGPNGIVSLWNTHGAVLARYPRSEALMQDPLHNAAEIAPLIESHRNGTLQGPSPIDGRDRTVIFRRVEGFPLVVSMRAAADDYLAMWRDDTRQRLLTSLGLLLLIILLTAMLIRHLRSLENAAQALRASERRAHAIFDSSFESMALLTPDGRVIACNESAQAFTGLRPEECGDRPIWDLPPSLLAGQAPQRLKAAVAEAAAGGIVRLEMDVMGPAGRMVADVSLKPVRDDAGAVTLLVAEARDVTDRVEAADRLARARDQAEDANRAKSAFLATMSHELRTPLNAIIGFSDIMTQELFGPLGSERYVEYARHIQTSGTHLLDLINDVLDLSKLEAGRFTLERQAFDPVAMLHGCLAVAAVPAERGQVRLVDAVQRPLPTLIADERALRQVVLNLLSNAVKFTPAGGTVTLACGRGPDGGLVIRVADTGIGIAPDALRRVTEPFQQADSSITRRFGGTGLGLAISRNLVELHGGGLSIASEPGHGTTVEVALPRALLAEPAVAAPERRAEFIRHLGV